LAAAAPALLLILLQVGDTMVTFQRRLWSLARNYHALAQQAPRTLVDVARIVEMQEQVCRESPSWVTRPSS
jgi:hypothetical protein